MKSHFLLRCAALFAPLCLIHGPGAAQAGAAKPQLVSLRCVREPLRDILPKLSAAAHESLSAERDMTEQKLILIVKDVPAPDVRDRIAEVVGGRWVGLGPNGDNRWKLERDPEVKRWLTVYARERMAAEQLARDQQTKYVSDFMEKMVAGAQDPNWLPPGGANTWNRDLTRFLGTISPEARTSVAQMIGANSATVDSGEYHDTGPAVRFGPGDMSTGQHQSLSEFVMNSHIMGDSAKSSLLGQLDHTIVSIGSTDGVAVEVELTTPEDSRSGSHHTFSAFGSAWAPVKLAEFKQAELERRMAKHPMPPKALLGAHFGEDGKPTPAVHCKDAEVAGSRVNRPAGGARRFELLEGLADGQNFNVVADYYTSSVRLQPAKEAPLRDLLIRAAAQFRTVFKVEDGWLLGRRELWPEDDIAETPAPLPESWISTKEKGKRLTFDDVGTMALLSEEQFSLFASYSDSGVDFDRETVGVRQRGNRPVLILYARLPEAQRAQIRTKEGLALSSVPEALQREALHRSGFEKAGVAPGMRLRVRLDDSAAFEVESLELIVPGADRLFPLVTWVPGP